MATLLLFIALLAGAAPRAAAQTTTTFDVLAATETLTVIGSTTLQGSSFSIGGTTFSITQGNVGIGTATPVGLFTVGNGSVTVLNSGWIGIGTTTPVAQFHITGAIVSVNTVPLGIAQYEWHGSYGAIRAGSVQVDRWDPSNIGPFSVALGFDGFAPAPFATVAGGFNNNAIGYGAFVGSGSGVQARADLATASGGENIIAWGGHSTIGGGFENLAYGERSTVCGGGANVANGIGAVVCGGGNDFAAFSQGGNAASGEAASVVGGVDNSAVGDHAFIGGGFTNFIDSGTESVIGGGNTNLIQLGGWATIGGGEANIIVSTGGTIGGGALNTVSGQFATVPGGSQNTAAGRYSFAAGQQSSATAQGSFVWADSQNSPFVSTTVDEFRVRAEGGFVLYSTWTAPTVVVSSGAIEISTSPSALTATPNIYISSSNGYVGIGNGSPSARMDVDGDAVIREALTLVSTGVILGQDTNGYSLRLSSGIATGGCIQYGDGSQQCTASSSLSNAASLIATQTFSGANTFESSTVFASGGRDIVLTTAAVGNLGALKIVGQTGSVQISTGMVFLGMQAPTSGANQGVLFFDSTKNAFFVSENGGAAKPIVDPPGNWACTVRSNSITATGLFDLVASCSGNEKVMNGGCQFPVGGGAPTTYYCGVKQTGQGWEYKGTYSGSSQTYIVFANCCL